MTEEMSEREVWIADVIARKAPKTEELQQRYERVLRKLWHEREHLRNRETTALKPRTELLPGIQDSMTGCKNIVYNSTCTEWHRCTRKARSISGVCTQHERANISLQRWVARYGKHYGLC